MRGVKNETQKTAAASSRARKSDAKKSGTKFAKPNKSVAKATSSKKAASKAAAKKPAPKKAAASQAAASEAAAKRPLASKKPPPRADLGAPIDGFFVRQPAHLRPILDELRALVDDVAPDAHASIKWGMPFFTLGGATVCAIAAFKAHVNLILAGPPGTFADPRGLLEGDGKTGRHLKLRSLDELPRDAVRGWLVTAAVRARRGDK